MEPSRALRDLSLGPYPVTSTPYETISKPEAKTGVLHVLEFASLSFATLALVPAMAHLFEMPAKMRFTATEYLTAQTIYSNWSYMGIFIVAAILTVAGWTVKAARVPKNDAFVWTATALACLVASQIVYWSFTYPANQITANWTTLPNNWPAMRTQWEYSHAVNAAFLSVAVLCLFSALLLAPKRVSPALRSSL